LREIEKGFAPDVVLTIFGPAYWKPQALHVCGFAEPWLYTSNRYAWQLLSFQKKITFQMRCIYKKLAFISGNIRAFIVETDALSREIEEAWPRKPVFVIPNNCGQAFYEYEHNTSAHNPIMLAKDEDEFRIVTLSQYYEHKNLEIIPRVARTMKDRNPLLRFKFFLSLDEASTAWQRIHRSAEGFGVGRCVCTVGVVQPQIAPFFYEGADAMYLPSVLECFSANYPEAMITGVPIVTTDLPFAHSVCEDAALYCVPLDAQSAADRLIELWCDKSLQQRLTEKGREIVKGFLTPQQKAQKYIEVCESLMRQKGNSCVV
jgi:glycosyltransferase involved in cell wall biosynthesis